MKRWRAAFLLALLAALPVLFAWNRSPILLQDSDTKGILAGIRDAHDPLKWFRGDWPISNGFYRPISALTFEADNALWRDNAAGYGFTNVALCFACVLLVFWLLRELTDRPWTAAAGAVVFAFWHNVIPLPLSALAGLAAWITLGIGIVRHRQNWRIYAPAFLTLLALSSELQGIQPLAGRMINWIPGRTASTMTVFALIALAAYARFERLRRPPPEPATVTPETPPATRNTEVGIKRRTAWPWAVIAALGTALALGSYEQAVMLPAVLVAVALAFRVGGARPLWTLHAVFWTFLLIYLGLRWQLLPHVPSGYQKQQIRISQSALWTECEYLFPPLAYIYAIPSMLESGILILLSPGPYGIVTQWVTTTVGYFQTRREPALALFGWFGSALAFLPMAFVKLFEHYHYWPMALRSGFVVAMGTVALRLAASAWSPPVRPAPLRPHPAPGSLPHR